MTRLKSGSLGTFAAGFAARVAGAGPEALEHFERLGFNLFTFLQLVDDQRDAIHPGAGSDLARSKATLPVVFYARQAPSGAASRDGGTLWQQTRQAYLASGASVYAALLALGYLGRARDTLRRIADLGYAITPLAALLERLSSEAMETLGSVGPVVGA
jgi:geranylgeranyl pyrophosphate synthase